MISNIQCNDLNGSQSRQNHYRLNSKLFEHCPIIKSHFRTILYLKLSQRCSIYKVSRHVYVYAVYYLDLFFMKKNKVDDLDEYQDLAFGALMTAFKFAQNHKSIINHINIFENNIRFKKSLEMQNKLIMGLKGYLNTPNYIQLLNIIATQWDQFCSCSDSIKFTEIRYLTYDKKSANKISALYQQMDYLYLQHQMLDYDIQQIVLILFYVKTKTFDLIQKSKPMIITKITQQQAQWKIEQDSFQQNFKEFLGKYQIVIPIENRLIQKILSFKVRKFTQIKEQMRKQELIQLLNTQTYKPFSPTIQSIQKNTNQSNTTKKQLLVKPLQKQKQLKELQFKKVQKQVFTGVQIKQQQEQRIKIKQIEQIEQIGINQLEELQKFPNLDQKENQNQNSISKIQNQSKLQQKKEKKRLTKTKPITKINKNNL